ncbi:hypothetical protein FB45DRAFT_85397 [Roridomyces roridus]|uniref:Uncharacterized protein n=1 Tax=Roridomyces roridus TaxID=1738132 RepID=A0AAD7FK74_9AGAR|nr:hypothetical protein FB45DRAFT_85397 [Roridomyces roridus]
MLLLARVIDTEVTGAETITPSTLWMNVLELGIAAFLCGIHCILFVRSVGILRARMAEFKRQWILLVAMIALFSLSTAQVVVIGIKSAVVTNTAGIDLYRVLVASLLIYVTSCVCADALLIYRCYVIWDSPYVCIPPVMLLIIASAFGYIRNVRIFQILSLTTVVSVTLLTISKIVYSAWQRRAILSQDLRQRYITASSAILESGALYALCVAIHFGLATHRFVAAESIFFSVVSQIVGIAPTLIIVRAQRQRRNATNPIPVSTVSSIGLASRPGSANKSVFV